MLVQRSGWNQPPPAAASEWRHLLIGGGGYMTGMEVAPDGSMVARADVAGAYRRASDSGPWDQLFTIDRLPANFSGLDGNGDLRTYPFGCYEIAIAPSNTSVLYAMFDDQLIKSTNAGGSWSATNWPSEEFDPNHPSYRTFGPHIGIDPEDPDHVIVCAPTTLKRSTNGGTSWAALSGVSTPTTEAGGLVAFDPSNPDVIYVHSYGNGTYQSTNGGASWSLLTSGPATARKIAVGDDGVMMLIDNGGGNANIWRWNGSWTNFGTSTGNAWNAIAPVRDDVGGKWYVATESHAELRFTSNNGTAWTASLTGSLTAIDVPWLAATNETFQSSGALSHHGDTLWGSEGIGIWRVDNPPETATPFNWVSNTAGIEIMIAVDIVHPPGGTPVVAMWDRPLMKLAFGGTYPSAHGPDYSHAIRHASCVAWASDDPNVVIGMVVSGEVKFCLSTDFGATWAEKTMPSGHSGWGSCEASDATHFVLAGTGDAQRMKFTTDAGDNWSNATMTGIPTTGDTGWGVTTERSRKIVCADRATIGTFYAYNAGRSGDSSFAGIWKSTDHGANWTKILAGTIAFGGGSDWDVAQHHLQMKCVPLNAGHFYITAGDIVGSVAGKFFRSTNGGTSLQEINNILEVKAFDFGAPKPGGSGYPSLYIAGHLSGVWGIYRCDNADAADPANFVWTLMDDWPLGWVGWTRCMAADPDTWNRPSFGYGDQGYFYHQPGN